MAATEPSSITFVLAGSQQVQEPATVVRGAAPPSLPAGLTRGRVTQSVRVGAQRGGARDIRITAVPGKDVVVLHVAGGPALVLHPESARDLLLAQVVAAQNVEAPKARAKPGTVKSGSQRACSGRDSNRTQRNAAQARGVPGTVRLSAVEIVTGIGTDMAADFAASEVVRRVDAQVDPGVFGLSPDELPKLKGTARATAANPSLTRRRAVAGSAAWHHVGDERDLQQTVDRSIRSTCDRCSSITGTASMDSSIRHSAKAPSKMRSCLRAHARRGAGSTFSPIPAADSWPRCSLAFAPARISGANDFAFFKGDKYRAQRESLKALGKIVAERGLRVERIVRVACPSRGTLLASKRLDAYVSILKWTLELAGVPVAPAIVDFLGEVAQRRADPERLPGLAAQIPDSPLVRWLNTADDPVPGELRVVAGDIEGDSVTSWVKTLLADAFYWTDNDLVVQTRSMYGGAPRAAGAIFLFDQGGKVSHFNYFHNDRTARAVIDALVQPRPPGFRVIGPLSWSGTSSTGTRAAARRADDAARATDKPAVFVLPGIRGSKLKANGKRTWHLATSVSSLPDAEPAPRLAALKISVINGDLMFVRQPLLLGTLHVDAPDRNGACRRQAARWCHDHGARYGPVSRRARHAPDFRQHRRQSRQSIAVATPGGSDRGRAWRRGQASRRRSRRHGATIGDGVVAAVDRKCPVARPASSRWLRH